MDARRLFTLLKQEIDGDPDVGDGGATRAEEIALILPDVAANAAQRLAFIRYLRANRGDNRFAEVVEVLIANLADEIAALEGQSARLGELRAYLGYAQAGTLTLGLSSAVVAVAGAATTAAAVAAAPVTAVVLGLGFVAATRLRWRNFGKGAQLDERRRGYEELRADLGKLQG